MLWSTLCVYLHLKHFTCLLREGLHKESQLGHHMHMLQHEEDAFRDVCQFHYD